MTRDLITDKNPLEPHYIPGQFIDRKNERTALNNILPRETSSSRNLHLQGPRGTGKTHLAYTVLNQLPAQINTCYINCTLFDTQYKALKQIAQAVTREQIKDGYHTSDLQRRIEERIEAVQAIVVLDEVDHLLLNDGDDLLYHLSRLKNNQNLTVITISSNLEELHTQVEERTYSSLQPYPISFEPYNGEETFRILAERARLSLRPQSLQREALTYIAATTQNIAFGLYWLKIGAETAGRIITESHVQKLQEQARHGYIEYLLEDFSEHHRVLYNAIAELAESREYVRTGAVYEMYQELSDDPLTNRRISDYLKQLEILGLITAKYHYGGEKGKTREIRLQEF